MSGTFSIPTRAHMRAVAAALRPDDARELEALGLTPEAALADSLAHSDAAVTWSIAGRPAAIAGVCMEPGSVLGPRAAQVWLLTTGLVDLHPWPFWRAARVVVADAARRAEVLFQFVDARYTRALRFAEALGFKRTETRSLGPSGLPFHLVTRRS